MFKQNKTYILSFGFIFLFWIYPIFSQNNLYAATNNIPNINDIQNSRIMEKLEIFMNLSVSDADQEPLTISVSSSNDSIIQASSVQIGEIDKFQQWPYVVTDYTKNLYLRVPASSTVKVETDVTITVYVTDGKSIVYDPFVLTVIPSATNSPPTLSDITDKQYIALGQKIFIPFTVADPDSDTISLTVSSTPLIVANGIKIEDNNIAFGLPYEFKTPVDAPKRLTLTVSLPLQVTETTVNKVTISIDDGKGHKVSDIFNITLNQKPNRTPTISDIPNQSTIANGNYFISFIVSDPDGDPLIVSTESSRPSFISPAQITLGDQGAFQTCPCTINMTANDSKPLTLSIPLFMKLAQTESLNITVIVSDKNAIVSDTFELRVDPKPNAAPIISNISDQNVSVNNQVKEIPFTIADSDADSVTISIASSNNSLVDAQIIKIVDNDGQHSWPYNFKLSDSNSKPLTLSVKSSNLIGDGQSVSITVSVTDAAYISSDSFVIKLYQNNPPVISKISNYRTFINVATSAIAFTVTDMETAPESLTITATSSNQILANDNDIVVTNKGGTNRVVNISPNYNESGTTTITLIVSDGNKKSSTTFELVVTNNKAPVIDSTTKIPTLNTLYYDGIAELKDTGTLISDFIKNVVTDEDAGYDIALRGIAIISVNNNYGRWEYHDDDQNDLLGNNANWKIIAPVSESEALLLPENYRIRFVPVSHFLGSSKISFRAWDQTWGQAGQKVNTSPNGKETAFSEQTSEAKIWVDSHNKFGKFSGYIQNVNIPIVSDVTKELKVELLDPITRNKLYDAEIQSDGSFAFENVKWQCYFLRVSVQDENQSTPAYAPYQLLTRISFNAFEWKSYKGDNLLPKGWALGKTYTLKANLNISLSNTCKYTIIDKSTGIDIKNEAIKGNTITETLKEGKYRLIITGDGIQPYEYINPQSDPYVDLNQDSVISISLIKDTQLKAQVPVTFGHHYLVNGFILNFYGCKSDFILKYKDMTGSETEISNDMISGAGTVEEPYSYTWNIEKGYSSQTKNIPSQDDITYKVNFYLTSDTQKYQYNVEFVKYTTYKFQGLHEQRLKDTIRQFDDEHPKYASICEREFYPLAGTTFPMSIFDSDGQPLTITISIPSLPLEYLFIDDYDEVSGNTNNNLHYNSENDHYDLVSYEPTKFLKATDNLIVKISYYTFDGEYATSSSVFVDLRRKSDNLSVRYNPYNVFGESEEDRLKRFAPPISLPILLNKNAWVFKSLVKISDSIEKLVMATYERGDVVMEGYRKETLAFSIQEEGMIYIDVPHLSGFIMMSTTAPTNPKKPTKQGDDFGQTSDSIDNGSCFIGVLSKE